MADLNATRNILSSDIEIKGSLKFEKELVIDGKLEGEIVAPNGGLIVGENAEVRGEIRTKSVSIAGKVHGNITVEERCELKSRSQMFGDLKAMRLTMEEGATFVGKSEVNPTKATLPQVVRPDESRSRSEEPQRVAVGAGR